MQITPNAAQIALSDLGWTVGRSPAAPFLVLAHHTMIEQVCTVYFLLHFNAEYELYAWSVYRAAILPEREQPQVVAKLEDQPALGLWVLPTPTQVYQLLYRAGEEGRGDLLRPNL